MTWSQINTLLKADEVLRIDDRLAMLEIAHNPYRSQKDAMQVFERLKRSRDALVSGPRQAGIKLGDLARAFGGVVQKYRMPDGRRLTKEEAEAERDRGDR